MRFPLHVLGFGFVLTVTAAVAQSTPQTQTPPVSPTTPAQGVGDGAQSKSGTPVPSTTTPPSTTGGVAGAASSSAPQSAKPASGNGGVSAMTDSDLESQIQTALSKEPTLTGDSPRVTISGDTIDLAGTVGTNKEKITATRIVQSYAGSKKLVNHLTVGGRSDKTSQKPPPVDTDSDRQPATTNPTNNPEPNKGSAKPPRF
jgi:BON domain